MRWHPDAVTVTSDRLVFKLAAGARGMMIRATSATCAMTRQRRDRSALFGIVWVVVTVVEP